MTMAKEYHIINGSVTVEEITTDPPPPDNDPPDPPDDPPPPDDGGDEDPPPPPPDGLPEMGTVNNPHWYLLAKVMPRSGAQTNYSLLDDADVYGLSPRIRWGAINPTRSAFEFDLIHSLANQARKRGKHWTLRIMAGVSSPGWIDAPMIATGEGSHFPLPWSEDLIESYAVLMSLLGNEFGDDPWLTHVHVSGYDESAEMHIRNVFSRPDYSDQKMSDAWIRRIDNVKDSFPTKYVNLNHSPEPFSEPVRKYMVEQGKAVDDVRKNRFVFQFNALKGGTNTNWDGYKRLKNMHDAGEAMVGAQHVGPEGSRWNGTWSQMLSKASQMGVRWHEFYQPDVGKI